MGRTSRSRRPCARGEVLCAEPGRPHPSPAGHAGPAREGKSRTMSMYADEESDEGVVPMKRSNNEGVSSAETVEGRTSPKGNGGQTAAARTLRRDTASNGLAAVRQAARQIKIAKHHRNTPLTAASSYKPGALAAHAGICAGGGQQWPSLPRPPPLPIRN